MIWSFFFYSMTTYWAFSSCFFLSIAAYSFAFKIFSFLACFWAYSLACYSFFNLFSSAIFSFLICSLDFLMMTGSSSSEESSISLPEEVLLFLLFTAWFWVLPFWTSKARSFLPVPVLNGTGSFSTTFFLGASFFTTYGAALTSSVTSGVFFFLDLAFLASTGAAGVSGAFWGTSVTCTGGLAFFGAGAGFGAGAFFSFFGLGVYSVLSIQVS